jgi:hypothetical protein
MSGSPEDQVICEGHGPAFQTFVCEHLAANPRQTWFSSAPDDENRWPDAWCLGCQEHFQREGEWNEKNQKQLTAKLLCHLCYESLSALVDHVVV